MVKRWTVTFPAREENERKRTAYVYLPASYDRDTERRYPVLYMFDGHNLFFDSDATYGKSWGLSEYLDKTGTEIIVAAVECNHSPDNGRLREYSPWSFTDKDYGSVEGLGDTTLNWYIDVFKAEIDRDYRTMPDRKHTFVAGSSMGGLMSLYFVLARNDVFSKAAALSPSLWAHSGELVPFARDASIKRGTVIYMDGGEGELGFRGGMWGRVAEFASALIERQVNVTCRIIPGGTHCEASWEKQLPFVFAALTYEK